MRYDHVVVGIDPSGNFNEGKGTTGLCVLAGSSTKILQTADIKASDYPTRVAYWRAHKIYLEEIIDRYHPKEVIVSIEDFVLYAHKSGAQANSSIETLRLLGYLEMVCADLGLSYNTRIASAVKKRWSNEILEHKGIIEAKGPVWVTKHSKLRLNRHILDSVRHAVHYDVFERSK